LIISPSANSGKFKYSIFNTQYSTINVLPTAESPLIAAIYRQKHHCCRIIFTHIPNISLLRILIDNFKNINFIIH